MSVEQALKTRGALLFYFSQPPTGAGRPAEAHVAISLGDGRTIEARSTKDGVGVFQAEHDQVQLRGRDPAVRRGRRRRRRCPDPPPRSPRRRARSASRDPRSTPTATA